MLRQLCRGSVITEICGWHSPEEWATQARALYALGQSPKLATVGSRPFEVGSALLYLLCAAHRAASLGGAKAPPSVAQGWGLAEELLGSALRDWGGKRDCDQWCQAVLNTFAVRAPQILIRLPWIDQIHSCRKPFAQRAQLSFVASQLMRPPQAPEGEAEGGPNIAADVSATFADSFAVLCADLLKATIASSGSGGGEEAGSSSSQRQKMRRDALRGLKSALRYRQKADRSGEKPDRSSPFSPAASAKVAAAVLAVRDGLSVWRGEVYQLCLHILRIVRPQHGKQSKDSGTDDAGRSGGKRQQRPSVANSSGASGDESPAKKKQRSGGASGAESADAGSATGSPRLEPTRVKKGHADKGSLAAPVPPVQTGKKFFEAL